MSFIVFLIAAVASVKSFMKGFATAAANAIQLGIIPEEAKEMISSVAAKMGLTLDTAVAIQNPELAQASWLLVGAALVGILGGLLCFFTKKFAAFLLIVAAGLCAAGGFIADGGIPAAFIYAVIFAVSAATALLVKSKPENKTSASKVSAPAQKVSLSKGGKVNLTKTYPISKLVVGLGWSVQSKGGSNVDLDASAFLLSSNGRVTRDSDFVFYSNRADSSGAVEHMGDNLTGSSGKIDDEQIRIDLKRIPDNISRIVFAVTIYDAEKRGHNFGEVSKAFIRVFDEENSRELLRYDLAEKFSNETALICAELRKENNEWVFTAIGDGFRGGLKSLCEKYGVNV